jgi:hypothetical protein
MASMLTAGQAALQDLVSPDPQRSHIAQPPYRAEGELGVRDCLPKIRQQIVEDIERDDRATRPPRSREMLGDTAIAVLAVLNGGAVLKMTYARRRRFRRLYGWRFSSCQSIWRFPASR